MISLALAAATAALHIGRTQTYKDRIVTPPTLNLRPVEAVRRSKLHLASA